MHILEVEVIDLPFFTTAVTFAVQVIAILEAIKNFFKDKKWNIPPWGYTLMSVVFAFFLAELNIPYWEWVYIAERLPVAIFAFCLAELFYDSIWKLVKNRLERSRGEDN